jgi:hypothetical protein
MALHGYFPISFGDLASVEGCLSLEAEMFALGRAARDAAAKLRVRRRD